MDCNMPEMNGYEATKIIKQKIKEKEFPQMIIIATTAYVFNEGIMDIYEVGMDGYLSKPLTQAKIRQTILKYLINVIKL